MITLNRFIVTDYQYETVQMSKPSVPEFWGGYYNVFKPKNGSIWTKKWSVKPLKGAYKSISVKQAHIAWAKWLSKN